MFMSEARNRHIKLSAQHNKKSPVAVVMQQQAHVHRNMGLKNELMRRAGACADDQLREEAAAQRAHGIGNGVPVQLRDNDMQELRLWRLGQATEGDADRIRRCISPHMCAICMLAGRTTVCVLATNVLAGSTTLHLCITSWAAPSQASIPCADEKGSSLLCLSMAPCRASAALISVYKRAGSSRCCHLLQGLPAGEGPQPACQ